jgi:hypothetical protein
MSRVSLVPTPTEVLRRSRTATGLYRVVRRRFRILRDLEMYVPYSSGGLRQLSDLTVDAINETPRYLDELAKLTGSARAEELSTTDFWKRFGAPDPTNLKRHFDERGSDKAGRHEYHFVYASILSDLAPVTSMLEVGLGSNNTDVPSNMGASGSPGASLRAFRDLLEGCTVFGADVDRRILFSEDRIQTFFVDQTDQQTVSALAKQLPHLDLVIDDGLHTSSANLAVLTMAMKRVRPGGWIVIEDIRPSLRPLWLAIAGLMREHRCFLVDTPEALMFCVKVGLVPSD